MDSCVQPWGTSAEERPPCPRCRSKRVAPLVYGYPTGEQFKAAERGELVHGGYWNGRDDPSWHCLDCHCEW